MKTLSKLTFKIFSLLLLGVPGVLAAELNGLCAEKNPSAYQKLAELPQGQYAVWWPEYLESIHNGKPDIWAAIMISSKPNVEAKGGGNVLIHLTPPVGQIIKTPGVFDGQWTKDRESEALFTAPNKWSVAKLGLLPGLTFFEQSAILKNGRNTAPIYRDPEFGNHYHSFGVVGRGVDEKGRRYVIHRAMNDKWGVSMRDYKAILDQNGNTLSMEPLGPERNLSNLMEDTEVVKTSPANHADPNPHRSYFDLPMISPDGRFFAVNNRRTMTTQIFEITPSGKRLVHDLGFETGKLSFGPMKPKSNELMVTFHIDVLDPAEGDKMSGIHSKMTKDIVVFKLEIGKNSKNETTLAKKEGMRVTAATQTGSGNYYPKWINDHELIYIHNENNREGFTKVDVEQLKSQMNNLDAIGFADCEFCKQKQSDKNYEAVVALGKMFADNCTKISEELTSQEVLLFALRLNSASCAQLSATWDQNKSKILSSKALFEMRPPKAPGQQPVPGFNFPESYSKRGALREEHPANRGTMEKITVDDLKVVCGALSK